MKKFFAPQVALFLILIAFSHVGKAQDSCMAKLDSAKELFNSGQIEEIPTLLNPCMQNGLSKEDLIQAHLLLIQVYLFDSNREKAEEVMTRFLHLFPDYQVQPTDPAELVELYKTFVVRPTWGLGLVAGANLSQVSVIQHFSTENLSSLDSKYILGSPGFDAGIRINRFFRRSLWLSLDLMYGTANLKRSDVLSGGKEKLTYTEETGWFSAPLYLNYAFGKGQWVPYVFAGGEVGYLFVDKSRISRHNLTSDSYPDVVQGTRDNRKNRNPLNAWALGGIGLRYKALGGYFNFAMSYKYSLMPLVKKENRYSDNDRLFYYQYIDDDFKLNHISCSLGYTKLFYSSRKRN